MHPLEDPRCKMAEARSALLDIASINTSGQPKAVIADLALEVQRMRDLLDGLAAEITCEATQAGVQIDAQLRRIADWVAHNTAAEPAQVARDNRIGEWLRRYPVLRQASVKGHINRQRLLMLKRCVNSRTAAKFYDDQELFVFCCRELEWQGFQKALGYWMALNDPDGNEPKAQKEDRKASTSKGAGGRIHGTFQLDAIAGHAVQTAIDQEIARLRASDDRTGNTRTRPQLKADAITNLIQRGAARPDGTIPAPLVHIVLGIGTAQQLLHRFDPTNTSAPLLEPIHVDPNDPNYRCELIDGTPIHPHAAYQYLGTANIRRLVVEYTGPNSPERIVDLSAIIKPLGAGLNAAELDRLVATTPSIPLETRSRTYSAPHKQALKACARGRCSIPGCNAPHNWLEADHKRPHSRGGRTHTDNGDMLCKFHNGLKGNCPIASRK